MTSPLGISVIYLPPQRLRDLFNNSQYPELIKQNRLVKKVLKSRELQEADLNKKDLPPGTKTETIVYYDLPNHLYLKVHQYVLPDGTINGGRPDPKAIVIDGKYYGFKEKIS